MAMHNPTSSTCPAWSPQVPADDRVLPLLYLHGLSTSDFGRRWSSSAVRARDCRPRRFTRLTAQWQGEAKSFGERDLSGTDYASTCGSTASTSRSASKQEKLCLLVMIGVRADGLLESRRPGRPAIGSRPSRGPICCGRAAAAG